MLPHTVNPIVWLVDEELLLYYTVHLAQSIPVLSLLCEHKQVFYSWSSQDTFWVCFLLHTTKKQIFLTRTQIWHQVRLQVLELYFGFRSQHQHVSSWVTMHFLKSACPIAHSTHTEQLNGNRRPQWEIITFAGTYSPQPLCLEKCLFQHFIEGKAK